MVLTICQNRQKIWPTAGISHFLYKGLVEPRVGMSGRAEREIYLPTTTIISSPSLTLLSLHPVFFLFPFPFWLPAFSLRQQVPERNLKKKKKMKWRGDRAAASPKLRCTILWDAQNKKAAKPRRSWQDVLNGWERRSCFAHAQRRVENRAVLRALSSRDCHKRKGCWLPSKCSVGRCFLPYRFASLYWYEGLRCSSAKEKASH